MKTFKHHWLGAVAIALAAGSAEAGMLPTFEGTSADGSNTEYKYQVSLSSGSTIQSGDFFTIYDFQGAVSGTSTQPAGWTLTIQNTGMTPSGVTPTADNPSLPNLTWTYNGPTITTPGALSTLFTIDSTISQTTSSNSILNFAAQTHPTGGGVEGNITSTTVPNSNGNAGPSGGGPSGGGPGLPEPAGLLLAGIGLPLAGLVGGLRRRQQALRI